MWDGSDSNMQHRVCVSVNPILNGRTHLVFSHHLLRRVVGRFVNPGEPRVNWGMGGNIALL